MTPQIQKYILSQTPHSTVLLVGEDKILRMQTAKKVAQAFLCAKKGCGECSVCQRIEKEIHPDVVIVRNADEDVLKVDLIRDLCEQMALSPLESELKFCIIEDCHRMLSPAQNAFLKTLEEPMGRRFFWLLTDHVDGMLETVVSRSIQFRLKPPPQIPAALEIEIKGQLSQLVQTHIIKDFMSTVSDKERAFQVVKVLKKECGQASIGLEKGQSIASLFENKNAYELIEHFERLQTLESRLRSNANYGLMLEIQLRELFDLRTP